MIVQGGEEPTVALMEETTVFLREAFKSQSPIRGRALFTDAVGVWIETPHCGRDGAPIRYFVPWANITGIRFGEV